MGHCVLSERLIYACAADAAASNAREGVSECQGYASAAPWPPPPGQGCTGSRLADGCCSISGQRSTDADGLTTDDACGEMIKQVRS